ncbi:MAG: type IV pilus biogenesis/stability protein PilW [Saccharospirillum sp.]
MKALNLVVSLVVFLLMSGCVTTTTGPFSDKRDLDEAVEIYTQIGYRHFERDNLFEAKRALDQALELDSRASGAHLGLARVFEREEEIELADEHFRDAMRFGGGTEARFQYAVFLYNQRRLEDALDQFLEVTSDRFYERRAQSFEFQALTARRLEDFDLAVESYERAVTLNRSLANSYLGLAELRRDRNQIPQAYQAYSGYIALVRAGQVNQTASTLWLGIRLANAMNDVNMQSSLELQLRNRYPESSQYREYQRWRQQQGQS